MVVLVDKDDNEIGVMEKMEAHRQDSLHRAFSVFVFNDKDEMLLHQRAMEKYHSAGLWTNACCSHPAPGEAVINAAQRRLGEEMGMTCSLHKTFDFIYRAQLENEMTEHELDHVFIATTSENPQPDASEVMNWKWIALDDLIYEINETPERFTIWFRIALPRVLKEWNVSPLNITSLS